LKPEWVVVVVVGVVVVVVVAFFFGAVAYGGFVKVGKCQSALSFPKPLYENPWYLCRKLTG
jgi:hypothetical protein